MCNYLPGVFPKVYDAKQTETKSGGYIILIPDQVYQKQFVKVIESYKREKEFFIFLKTNVPEKFKNIINDIGKIELTSNSFIFENTPDTKSQYIPPSKPLLV